MALAKVLSCAVVGLDGELVEVEVDIAEGMPAFAIVGLPDAAVQEAKERVRSAIRNSGFPFPSRRITVNLAPACSIPRSGWLTHAGNGWSVVEDRGSSGGAYAAFS